MAYNWGAFLVVGEARGRRRKKSEKETHILSTASNCCVSNADSNFDHFPFSSHFSHPVCPLSNWEEGSTNDVDPLVAQLVKNPPAMQETTVRFLGRKDLLEKG